jgi:hypothetical protein
MREDVNNKDCRQYYIRLGDFSQFKKTFAHAASILIEDTKLQHKTNVVNDLTAFILQWTAFIPQCTAVILQSAASMLQCLAEKTALA